MRDLIVGTAGHVDHGKTALVKALTGIDTDRLKEEKERGITIDLGFAFLNLPDGRRVGVVDVPGHERFVKNMVAGAGGIHLVILVIAADEGVMPQTREHLAICSLLGIRKGIVVLTKVDLVDEAWLKLVEEDVKDFLRGTFLEGAPVIYFSALDGRGLTDLLAALSRVADEVDEIDVSGIFRLPVDRVFTIRGFGTVVTGTTLSGRLTVGDEVSILPKGIVAKVRGIEVYKKQVTEARAGQRTAVNLQGVERDLIERGDVLTHRGELASTKRLDVVFQYLSGMGSKLKNRTLARLHVGTSEIMARIILIGRDELAPGQSSYAQQLLEEPAVVMAQDRFVLRSYSPITTIGGGVILDPEGRQVKRLHSETEAQFATLATGEERKRIKIILERAHIAGITEKQLLVRTGIPKARLLTLLSSLSSSGEAYCLEGEERRYFAGTLYTALRQRVVDIVGNYHRNHPLKEGIKKEELRGIVGQRGEARLFQRVLFDLEREGRIHLEQDFVRLPEHRVTLGGDLGHLREKLLDLYRESGLAPPTIKEVFGHFENRRKEVESVITVLQKEGLLVKVNSELFYHFNIIEKLKADYEELLRKKGRVGPGDFRELTGLSRKFIIPLMEYFDTTKLTIRAGEYRLLRSPGNTKDDK